MGDRCSETWVTLGVPWKNNTLMTQRFEFVLLAQEPGVNFRELCRRFQISAKSGYKWLRRFKEGGIEALKDRSKRPRHSPRVCPIEVAAKVVALRQRHPTWSGRKLRRRLVDLGHPDVPAASTCTEILRRAKLLGGVKGAGAKPFIRFERPLPNDLWQIDFKGHFPTQSGVRCHPLTMLDDHSRFNLALEASGDETTETVQSCLTRVFAQYGLPDALLGDNGPPWGSSDPDCQHTQLTVWLMRLGVRVLHGRPYHPQTQGKEERFHRTLIQDVVSRHTWRDLAHCRRHFKAYRQVYNCERPHDSLDGDVPIKHYKPSSRSFPGLLPPLEYSSDNTVRKVHSNGVVMFSGQTWYIGRAFAQLPIGLRPSAQADGQWQVLFGTHLLGTLDVTTPRIGKHTSRPISPIITLKSSS